LPNAGSWTPSGALERIASKTHGAPLGRAEELASELPENVALVFPEGQKSPDLLLRITSQTGEIIWWLGDLFSNTTSADQIWPLRVLSRLAGSGPGYRRNTRPELVYVRNREAWLSSVRSVLAANPPRVVVPAHGDPVLVEYSAAHGRSRQGLRKGILITLSTARRSEAPTLGLLTLG